MSIDPSIFSGILLFASALSGAFLAALWLSLVFWTYRDVRERIRDPLARILALMVVIILFIPGIGIYLLLRPPLTLDEEYQRTLEEEALLQTIEEYASCPGCGRQVDDGWVVCPGCFTDIRKKCKACNSINEKSWKVCPFCGNEDLEFDQEIPPNYDGNIGDNYIRIIDE
jgi:RNA polymerase subunit RPABC4/transcription elongation factor Spt4